ncbi:RNA-binding protein 25 [Halotydeus destructor]|nr:RNA-binding protein 25 [Halotydeus destructor]
MAFNHPFLHNLNMGGFVGQNPFQPSPMGGLMPINMPNSHQLAMGVTVPTGVASISAPPVRNLLPTPSLLGFPGMPPTGMPFQMHQPPLIPPPVVQQPSGPVITVFVGSITEKAPDMLIRQLLSKCGNVANWKRVQGANGKLQAFGFCDYSDPDSAMRAIRILHELQIGDKKLMVKAGDKAKEQLLDYVKQKIPGATGPEAVVNDETKKEDQDIRKSISLVLREHELELNKDSMGNKDRKKDKIEQVRPDDQGLDDMEIETEEKRFLIHREIDKFRDTYKESEAPAKELENERPDNGPPRDVKRRDDRRDDRRDRNDRDQQRDRERPRRELESRDRSGRRDRDRFESNNRNRSNVDVEDEEEEYERRRLERKLKEKEASYQERLRNWEARESRKSREIEKDKMREVNRKEEEGKEARRLKQFLEDYDDDRDDPKFYRGNALSRRLRERQKEIEEDERDRRQEKKELEDLRRKLVDEGHPDPDSEAKKRLTSNESERTERERIVSEKIKELRNDIKSLRNDDSSLGAFSDSTPMGEEIHVKSFSFTGVKLGASQTSATTAETDSPSVSQKRKKMKVNDIFNANDDDDQLNAKKRRLPMLIDDNDSNQSLLNSKSEVKTLSSEEKRKQIKQLIDIIPTSKDELFKYSIEWSLVDNNLMEKRIRPWINKKITDYLGEEDQPLLDFICSKLQAHTTARGILDDVAMVLDEEAEIFVVKMWRLLIYEIEAKKLGLTK